MNTTNKDSCVNLFCEVCGGIGEVANKRYWIVPGKPPYLKLTGTKELCPVCKGSGVSERAKSDAGKYGIQLAT